MTGRAPMSPWLAVVSRLWSIVFAGLLAAVACVLVVLFAVPRRYEASMTLAAVTTQRMPAVSGALAGLSGLSLAQQGLSATPDLVAQLMTSRRVLAAVAARPDGAQGTIGVRVASGRALTGPEVEARLRDLIATNIDKKTGLVAFGVVHADSALARTIASEIVAITSRTFTSVLKSQAEAQRRGQEARVDSMASQLRTSEEALLTFQRGNRTLSAYAEASLQRQRLERQINIASQAFIQAATEREAAVARELEQTPALVVVDPLPSELRRIPRYTAILALIAFCMAAFALALWYVLQALVAGLAVKDPVAFAGVSAALSRIPLLRLLVRVPTRLATR